MKLLGWDTSSKAGAIVALEWEEPNPKKALWQNVKLISEWSLDVDSQHSERLLWGIHQTLESARFSLTEIDLFAVGVGPGSFTGIRIGVTTARTLAHACHKPLIGVSSLSALARPAALMLLSLGLPDTLVVAATDAAKGELFSLEARAADLCGSSQAVEQSERASAPKALIDSVEESRAPWIAVGDGRNRYPDEWKRLQKSAASLAHPFCDQIQGRFVGMLAFESWCQGLERPALEVHPRYLRASDAEVKLKAGLLKASPVLPPQ